MPCLIFTQVNQAMLARQRRHIYTQLQTRLDATVFDLVLPLQQIEAAFAGQTSKYNLPGYCFGYNEAWQQLLSHDVSTFSFSWKELINSEHYVYQNFALTAQVRAAQKTQQSQFTPRRQNFSRREYFAKTSQLIEAIVAEVYAEFVPGKILFVELGHSSFASACAAAKHLVKSWHQIRICIDSESRLHLFDANIGWFKSTGTNSIRADLTQLLNQVFEILSYDGHFNVMVVSNLVRSGLWAVRKPQTL